MPDDYLGSDLLRGAGPLAAFFYGEDTPQNRRRIFYLCERPKSGDKPLPLFKIGGVIHGRKSAILRVIEERERAAVTRTGSSAS